MIAAHPLSPTTIWGAWTLEPSAVALLIAVVLHAVGLRRLRARNRAHGVARPAAFYAGITVLALALLSPLHALAEALFSMHMVQHLLLILVAAPLLVWSRPGLPLMAALPAPVHRSYVTLHRLAPWRAFRRAGRNIVVVWTATALAMWSWHLPTLYEAGLASFPWHAVEHLTFLGTAILFWSVTLPSSSPNGRSPAPSIALVFATGLQSAVLGAVLTFADRPLYASHAREAAHWGVDALTDQRLAGLIMWVPAGAVYLLVMAWLFLTWMKRLEATTRPRAASTGDGS